MKKFLLIRIHPLNFHDSRPSSNNPQMAAGLESADSSSDICKNKRNKNNRRFRNTTTTSRVQWNLIAKTSSSFLGGFCHYPASIVTQRNFNILDGNVMLPEIVYVFNVLSRQKCLLLSHLSTRKLIVETFVRLICLLLAVFISSLCYWSIPLYPD